MDKHPANHAQHVWKKKTRGSARDQRRLSREQSLPTRGEVSGARGRRHGRADSSKRLDKICHQKGKVQALTAGRSANPNSGAKSKS